MCPISVCSPNLAVPSGPNLVPDLAFSKDHRCGYCAPGSPRDFPELRGQREYRFVGFWSWVGPSLPVGSFYILSRGSQFPDSEGGRGRFTECMLDEGSAIFNSAFYVISDCPAPYHRYHNSWYWFRSDVLKLTWPSKKILSVSRYSIIANAVQKSAHFDTPSTRNFSPGEASPTEGTKSWAVSIGCHLALLVAHTSLSSLVDECRWTIDRHVHQENLLPILVDFVRPTRFGQSAAHQKRL